MRFFAALLLTQVLACASAPYPYPDPPERDEPSSPEVTDRHRSRIISMTAAAEGDISISRQFVKEGRSVEAMNLLLNRVKQVQTILYDELLVKSQAYAANDLPTAREYARLITDLQRAETGLIRAINGPLNRILNRILIDNPDPRRRQEAVEALLAGANEIFIQFKTGYRTEIVRSLRVRFRSEPNTAVRQRMAEVLYRLAVAPAEKEQVEKNLRQSKMLNR